MIKELNTLAFATSRIFFNVKNTGPLIEKQTQIQRARIEDQSGMSVQMLVCERTNLLMDCIFITTNTFGLANTFERRQNVTDIAAHPPRIVRDARKCQFCFANIH